MNAATADSGTMEALSAWVTTPKNTYTLMLAGAVVLVIEMVMMAAIGDPASASRSLTTSAALFSIVASGGALFVAYVLGSKVLAAGCGNARMQEIAAAISEGSNAFLFQEYTWLATFVGVVAALMAVSISFVTGIVFVVGAALSAVTGYIGMSMAVKGNVRTAAAATLGLNPALKVAFNTGAVMGMCVVGFGLSGLSAVFLLLSSVYTDTNDVLTHLAGFGFGASSIALFARVGGGIYTKAADVGADLVGKVEAGIPEDDPRNPATIADNVGDNVGDTAGMGADLFESYVGSIVAAATLGLVDYGHAGVALPFLVAAVGILASVFGVLFIRTKEGASQEDLLATMRNGTLSASAMLLVLVGAVLPAIGIKAPVTVFGVIVIGLVAGILIGASTEYATSHAFYPTQSIAASAETGPATVIIQGLSVGMFSTLPPIVIITVAIVLSLKMCGVFGVAIAAVGMLSTLGVTLATDAYGPVADNAGGIAEMAELPSEVRDRTDALDGLGNTTAATGKGFAIGSAVLTALALLSAFQKEVSPSSGQMEVDIVKNEMVMPGLLIGGMLPFIFSGFTMLAVGKSAGAVIEEVRRQFKLGILEGTVKPDYAACVQIVTVASLRQMVAPGMVAVLVPTLVGLLMGPAALAGLLTGSIVSGAMMAIMMSNAGGAWDNCKKYIEAGHHGGKGSECHKAAVTGDTVGDPFKDTSGPALNILIKLMSIIALVLAPVLRGMYA